MQERVKRLSYDIVKVLGWRKSRGPGGEDLDSSRSVFTGREKPCGSPGHASSGDIIWRVLGIREGRGSACLLWTGEGSELGQQELRTRTELSLLETTLPCITHGVSHSQKPPCSSHSAGLAVEGKFRDHSSGPGRPCVRERSPSSLRIC